MENIKNNFAGVLICILIAVPSWALGSMYPVAVSIGMPIEIFAPIREVSKFFIILAMAAIGFNTDVIKLVRTGGKPLIMGFACWTGITAVSLIMQRLMEIW
ncbi:putative sulfate exporter family transporter [Proteocatella sphenisci]|uniref:putative sulfate exporter family transporter n=1 Tax=Proteocatella sphenisci TaxID=181070 RepID=UPI00048FB242|nr:putative sulfate exporter family transporter [Proteocatella sphenisci]